MTLKAFGMRGLYRIAYQAGVSTFWARRLPVRRIIMLHGVGTRYLPVESFEAQIEYLAQNFEILPLADLVRNVQGGNPSGKRPEIALTFDDGTRNNFTLAYPTLKRLGVPATFFICPGLVDAGVWLWNHDARERLRSIAPAQRESLRQGWGADSNGPDELVEWMKWLPRDRRCRMQQDIQKISVHFDPSIEQKQMFDLMNWSEIQSLDSKLITIGSHSMTHPILTTLEKEELVTEIRDSRSSLETRLNRPVEYFCYPNGSNNQLVVEIVKQNYRAAVIARPSGFVSAHDFNPHRIPRISIAEDLPQFAWRLHRPTA